MHISLTVIDLATDFYRLDILLLFPVPECGGADVEPIQHLGFRQKFLLGLLDQGRKQCLLGLVDKMVGKLYKVFDFDVQGKTCDPTLDEFNNIGDSEICFRRMM